jgi:hypothetical protein
MTWAECEKFYVFFKKNESEKLDSFIRMFAFRNLESSRIAQYGKATDVRQYLNDLRKKDEVSQENNIDEQFEGVTFEQ